MAYDEESWVTGIGRPTRRFAPAASRSKQQPQQTMRAPPPGKAALDDIVVAEQEAIIKRLGHMIGHHRAPPYDYDLVLQEAALRGRVCALEAELWSSLVLSFSSQALLLVRVGESRRADARIAEVSEQFRDERARWGKEAAQTQRELSTVLRERDRSEREDLQRVCDGERERWLAWRESAERGWRLQVEDLEARLQRGSRDERQLRSAAEDVSALQVRWQGEVVLLTSQLSLEKSRCADLQAECDRLRDLHRATGRASTAQEADCLAELRAETDALRAACAEQHRRAAEAEGRLAEEGARLAAALRVGSVQAEEIDGHARGHAALRARLASAADELREAEDARRTAAADHAASAAAARAREAAAAEEVAALRRECEALRARAAAAAAAAAAEKAAAAASTSPLPQISPRPASCVREPEGPSRPQPMTPLRLSPPFTSAAEPSVPPPPQAVSLAVSAAAAPPVHTATPVSRAAATPAAATPAAATPGASVSSASRSALRAPLSVFGSLRLRMRGRHPPLQAKEYEAKVGRLKEKCSAQRAKVEDKEAARFRSLCLEADASRRKRMYRAPPPFSLPPPPPPPVLPGPTGEASSIPSPSPSPRVRADAPRCETEAEAAVQEADGELVDSFAARPSLSAEQPGRLESVVAFCNSVGSLSGCGSPSIKASTPPPPPPPPPVAAAAATAGLPAAAGARSDTRSRSRHTGTAGDDDTLTLESSPEGVGSNGSDDDGARSAVLSPTSSAFTESFSSRDGAVGGGSLPLTLQRETSGVGGAEQQQRQQRGPIPALAPASCGISDSSGISHARRHDFDDSESDG